MRALATLDRQVNCKSGMDECTPTSGSCCTRLRCHLRGKINLCRRQHHLRSTHDSHALDPNYFFAASISPRHLGPPSVFTQLSRARGGTLNVHGDCPARIVFVAHHAHGHRAFRHSTDQFAQLFRNRWPPGSRFPPPQEPKTSTVPANQHLGLRDDEQSCDADSADGRRAYHQRHLARHLP